jgi:hypothetical protein
MKHPSPPSKSPASLLLQRTKIPKTLPPLEEVLRGSFLRREIRCGKPTCRCAKGPGHPIAYVTVTFPGGRTQQVTVPRDLARTVRLWISNYRRWWQAIEEVSAINRRLLQLREIPSESPQRPSGAPLRLSRSTARRRRSPKR